MSAAAEAAEKEAAALPSITLSPREQFDLEMIAIGAFSPLTGFMGQADFESRLQEMRLANGTVWPIPVTLCPPDDVAANIKSGRSSPSKDGKGRLLGTMTVREKYRARQRTGNPQRLQDRRRSPSRRGQIVQKQGNTCIAGDDRCDHHDP